jgi:hypothetical protein
VHSGQPRRIRSNLRVPRQGSLEVKPAGSAPAPLARHKPLDFKGISRYRRSSPTPRKARGCVTYRSPRCNMEAGRENPATGWILRAARYRSHLPGRNQFIRGAFGNVPLW